MPADTPAVLRAEHGELCAQLARIVREPGAVGEAARRVEALLRPHLDREEAFALPLLGTLEALVHEGGRAPDAALVAPMAQRLTTEMPALRAEHRAILEALSRLRAAADAASMPQHGAWVERFTQHIRMEEQVFYPAAMLVGRYVSERR
jgi:hemerythrin-like domain-containing protein